MPGLTDRVDSISKVNEEAIAQSKSWHKRLPAFVVASPSRSKWFRISVYVVIAAFPAIAFYSVRLGPFELDLLFDARNWALFFVLIWPVLLASGLIALAATSRYERREWLRACMFVVIAVFPAIASKWMFHNLFGFRLLGAAGSWATIWAVALILGLLAFAVTSRYEHRNRAARVAVAAFLCAFAIMIFNWNQEFDINVQGLVLQFPIAFTMPIVLFGSLALIATVVVDKHRWSWPFWACWMFIYIFTHAIAGSAYVTDLSKLDLFSWINMSLIVFIFLFAIPAYFASDQAQGRARLATPNELSG